MKFSYVSAAVLVLSIALSAVSCSREIPTTPTAEMGQVEKVQTQSPTPYIAPSKTATQTEPTVSTSTPEAAGTLNPIQLNDIHWMASFETGDLSEYEDNFGEFIRQSQFGSYEITSEIARRGEYSAALSIDTSRLSDGNAAAAYLAYYDNPSSGYYSAWLYIPEEVTPLSWWNFWQWKSTYNGDSDDSVPMWILDLTTISTNPDELLLTLAYRPDSNALKIGYKNAAAVIQKGEWVHISTYYVKSTTNEGVVGVWLNGEEVFYLENVTTALSDNTLYWSINNYTDSISPSPCTIYFDDVVISQKRIEPTTVLP